jgi:N-acetylneuraminic acid mutarotase
MKTTTVQLIAFLLFISVIINVKAQDRWVKKADFPGDARSFGTSFSLGNHGYMGMGFTYINSSAKYYGDLWEYNADSNKWIRKADIPYAKRFTPVGFSIGSKGYVGGGDGDVDFWQYDPAKNTWIPKALIPGSARIYSVSFNIGNKGYTGIGSIWNGGGAKLKDLWEYDPATDQWTQKADFPGGKRSHAMAFVIGNKGYVCGGVDSSGNIYNDLWEYNPATDKWTQKQDMGIYPRWIGIGFSINGKGYVGLGNLKFGPSNDLFEYDTAQNNWTQVASADGSFAISGSTAFVINNYAYVGTGHDISGNYVQEVWQYGLHTSGIKNDANEEATRIYPNPSSGNFTIQTSQPVYSLEITDINGKLVYSAGEVYDHSSINSGLPSGLYFLKLKTTNTVIVKKLVIND